MTHNKKRKISSCFLCQKDNTSQECDGVRPCGRCVRLGVPHMCIGIDMGVPMPVPSSRVEEPAPPSSGGESNYEPMSDPFATGRGFKSSNVTVTEPSSPESSASPAPPRESAGLGEATLPISQESLDTLQGSASPGSQEISRKQNNLNIYFMKELKKLKGDQKRLDDEVLHLKLENSNLAAHLKTSQWQVMRLMEYFSQLQMNEPQQSNGQLNLQRPLRALDAAPAVTDTQSSPKTANNSRSGVRSGRKERMEQPMVVYDLSKSTATVLTANTTFCQMIGYELNEMIGMPWTEFIPQEAARRTMNTILQQKNVSSVIKLEQVYRHRTGGLFVTHDTHTILFGSDGMPTSDFVTLSFPESNPGGPPFGTFLPPSIKCLDSDSQPVSSTNVAVETPSEDEYDDSASRPAAQASNKARNGTHQRSCHSPQSSAAKRHRRTNRKIVGDGGHSGASSPPIKLLDSIPKASVSVLEDDEDAGPHVQQIPFDEVLTSNSRRRPHPPEGPTSIFQMPSSTTFPTVPPFPPMSSPLPGAASGSSTAPHPSAGPQHFPTAPSMNSPSTFAFDDSSMDISSPHLGGSPLSGFLPSNYPMAPVASSSPAQSAPAGPFGGPAIPLNTPDMPGMEDGSLGDFDLDPASWTVDEDFLNSLLAPQHSYPTATQGGGSPHGHQ